MESRTRMTYAQASKQPAAIGANYTLKLPSRTPDWFIYNNSVIAGFLSALFTLVALFRSN